MSASKIYTQSQVLDGRQSIQHLAPEGFGKPF